MEPHVKNKAPLNPTRLSPYLAIFKPLLGVLFVVLSYGHGYAQCPTSGEFCQHLVAIEKDTALKDRQKLQQVLALKERYNKCNREADSAYIRMLYRAAILYKNLGKINEAIHSLQESIRVNAKTNKRYNKKLAISCYYMLGAVYLDQNFYTEALTNLDNCIAEGRNSQDSAVLVRVSSARQKKGYIYHQWGDDQKNAAETKLGLRPALQSRNSTIIVDLFNRLAQAYASIQMTPAAMACLDSALHYIPATNNQNATADNYKERAVIQAKNGDTTRALQLYNQAITARLKAHKEADLAKDYLDAGNLVMNKNRNHPSVKIYYQQALALATKTGDGELAGKVLNNMGVICARNKQQARALQNYHSSLVELVPSLPADPLQNPSYQLCKAVNKLFLYQVLANKVQCLLNLYRQTGYKKYITSCLQTALLTDSVMTGMRRAQTAEQSKLRWLSDAHDVFANALEACYLARNDTLAFYFMEKSRSVLLSERLNELGANAVLPPVEAEKEKEYLLAVMSEQQQLSKLAASDTSYARQENKYLEVVEGFENYTKSLQNKYPAYYQYRFADDVPQLGAFQKHLRNAQQCFVHYFFSDSTCVYMLVTTPDSVKMIRQAVKYPSMPAEFVKLCSNRQASNKNDKRLDFLSNQLYSLLFKPLHLPLKRVVICNDTYLLPFEALATDTAGKNWLINQYVFSYAYSARSLMKKPENSAGTGDCLLVAPGRFAARLGVSSLDASEKFLEESGAFYTGSRVLVNGDANKKKFLKQFPRYKIVSVYSHATAGSGDNEPILYMQDDSIRLSELQSLDRPATQLVILSACQTSVGKNATGEGIYSLARGFAAAGVPSIATTLWEADANAMYIITKGFHRRISQGMRKDDALQQAKLAYINEQGQPLPYYWATMILAGNTDPVQLAPLPADRFPLYKYLWWLYIPALLFLATVMVWMGIKKSSGEVSKPRIEWRTAAAKQS